MSQRCLYEMLGVDATASPDAIRKAYRRMALLTHPDKQSTTSFKCSSFIDIVNAAGILLDPFQRAAYDASRLHQLVRDVGRISDVFLESDGDVEIAHESVDDGSSSGGQVRLDWGIAACRCGGEFRFIPRIGVTRYVTECDTCSLVVECVLANVWAG